MHRPKRHMQPEVQGCSPSAEAQEALRRCAGEEFNQVNVCTCLTHLADLVAQKADLKDEVLGDPKFQTLIGARPALSPRLGQCVHLPGAASLLSAG